MSNSPISNAPVSQLHMLRNSPDSVFNTDYSNPEVDVLFLCEHLEIPFIIVKVQGGVVSKFKN